MTWFSFWQQLNEVNVIVLDIVRSLPTILRDMIFAFTGFSCVFILIKMVREVRS